jgi:hypothetical protein
MKAKAYTSYLSECVPDSFRSIICLAHISLGTFHHLKYAVYRKLTASVV